MRHGTPRVGAGLQRRDRIQRRPPATAHLRRRLGIFAARLDSGARRRTLGHLDPALPRRLRHGQRRLRFAGVVPRAGRFALETSVPLLPRPLGVGVSPPLGRRASETLQGDLPQGHHRAPLRRILRPRVGYPAQGRVQDGEALRHHARPHPRGDHAPPRRLQRVAGAAQIPHPELEHGHDLQSGDGRPARLSLWRVGPPHAGSGGRSGQLRHRGGLPRDTRRAQRPHAAPAHSPRVLERGAQRRQHRRRGRHGHNHHHRRRHTAHRRPSPAPPARGRARDMGHRDGYGGGHGRHSGLGQSGRDLGAQRCLHREGELRPQPTHGTRVDVQVSGPAGVGRRLRRAHHQEIRHLSRPRPSFRTRTT